MDNNHVPAVMLILQLALHRRWESAANAVLDTKNLAKRPTAVLHLRLSPFSSWSDVPRKASRFEGRWQKHNQTSMLESMVAGMQAPLDPAAAAS